MKAKSNPLPADALEDPVVRNVEPHNDCEPLTRLSGNRSLEEEAREQMEWEKTRKGQTSAHADELTPE